jgi:integrase
MARKRKKGRVFWRNGRAYGDFRDLGGGREALKAPGDRLATQDEDIAAKLASDRVAELEDQKRNKVLLGIERQAGLEEFAAYHLRGKARAGKVTDEWLNQTESQLRVAVKFFGPERDLATILVKDAQEYAAHLSTIPNRRRSNQTLSSGSQRGYLNALSNLYRRAIAEGYTTLNPVAGMLEKPTAGREEAKWLEVSEAALLLESARTFQADPNNGTRGAAFQFMYPLIATFLLTGGRRRAVFGLEVDDISFHRKTVTFRPNQFRRLKTTTSHRTIPLFPQLEEILRPYLVERERAGGLGRLLFPAPGSHPEKPVNDIRKSLDRVAERAGWQKGEIRTKIFRHTFCAAALQTLDRGYPISPWTVARWMGHGGRSLVDRVYGHLGETRHRSEVVEYRIEHHREAIEERLEALKNRG